MLCVLPVAPKVGFYLVAFEGNYIIYRFPPDKFTMKIEKQGVKRNSKLKITECKSTPN